MSTLTQLKCCNSQCTSTVAKHERVRPWIQTKEQSKIDKKMRVQKHRDGKNVKPISKRRPKLNSIP